MSEAGPRPRAKKEARTTAGGTPQAPSRPAEPGRLRRHAGGETGGREKKAERKRAAAKGEEGERPDSGAEGEEADPEVRGEKAGRTATASEKAERTATASEEEEPRWDDSGAEEGEVGKKEQPGGARETPPSNANTQLSSRRAASRRQAVPDARGMVFTKELPVVSREPTSDKKRVNVGISRVSNPSRTLSGRHSAEMAGTREADGDQEDKPKGAQPDNRARPAADQRRHPPLAARSGENDAAAGNEEERGFAGGYQDESALLPAEKESRPADFRAEGPCSRRPAGGVRFELQNSGGLGAPGRQPGSADTSRPVGGARTAEKPDARGPGKASLFGVSREGARGVGDVGAPPRAGTLAPTRGSSDPARPRRPDHSEQEEPSGVSPANPPRSQLPGFAIPAAGPSLSLRGSRSGGTPPVRDDSASCSAIGPPRSAPSRPSEPVRSGEGERGGRGADAANRERANAAGETKPGSERSEPGTNLRSLHSLGLRPGPSPDERTESVNQEPKTAKLRSRAGAHSLGSG